MSSWLLAVSVTLFAGANVHAAQSSLPRESPFLPPGGEAAPVAAGETLEFAGVSTVGKQTDLIIHDKSTKKSRWIPIGATVDGIAALKYDSRLEQAVIRAHGVEKVLLLRKSTGPINAPQPVVALNFTPVATMTGAAVPPNQWATPPLPPASPAISSGPLTPELIKRQETEARMLVSDLLEIGMVQRKAYEEAQRQASGQGGVRPISQPADGTEPGPISTPDQ